MGETKLTHSHPLTRFARAAVVIKEPDLLDLFVSLGHDSGRDTLKATLEKLGITDQHARVRPPQIRSLVKFRYQIRSFSN